MSTAIIYYSEHHGNTKKLLNAIKEADPAVELIDVTKEAIHGKVKFRIVIFHRAKKLINGYRYIRRHCLYMRTVAAAGERRCSGGMIIRPIERRCVPVMPQRGDLV